MRFEMVLVSLACVMLVGCGGGGSGGGTEAPVGETPSVFAAAVEMACVGAGPGRVCEAPTSSKMSMDAMWSMLTDPSAGSLKFRVFGPQVDLYTLKQRAASGQPLVAVEGAMSWGGSEQDLVVGASAISFKGLSYSFSSEIANGMRTYRAGEFERIHLFRLKDGADARDIRSYGIEVSDWTGSSLTELREQYQIKTWLPELALLTDRNDLTLPASASIQYTGFVIVNTGDGRVLGGDSFNVGQVTCPIDLTLDTRSGQLVSGAVACTDAHGGEMSFTLPTLQVTGSRVRPLRAGDTALASAPKFFVDDNGTLAGGAPPFRIEQIVGGVFGSNAGDLAIRGASSQGVFTITASRL